MSRQAIARRQAASTVMPRAPSWHLRQVAGEPLSKQVPEHLHSFSKENF